MSEKKKSYKPLIIIILTVPLLLIMFFSVFVGIRRNEFIHFEKLIEGSVPLDSIHQLELSRDLQKKYASRYQILQPLPYNLETPKLNILAESAILIDISNGNIIYEKNADEIIPPASMTKLFTMYVIDEEVSAGRLHYDDIIPLPPESWTCNMPPHSSLMFLGEGQIVTLKELLLGLSIASGNDAAYALAYTVSGSMEAFIERMNNTCYELGLSNTHFVESSGYSEKNTTTAREMATFCRIYLQKHPDSLKMFHAVPEFTYPKKRNLAPGDIYGPQDFSKGFPTHITMGITQKNTNPLLGILEGCDGLKTGYIDESGYNLALTAERNGTRYLSVTMKGPGKSTKEGQEGRIHDGTELMEFAFGSFADYHIASKVSDYYIKVLGGREKIIKLVPGFLPETGSVPFITGNSLQENLSNVQFYLDIPEYITGPIVSGQEYGKIQIILNNYILDTIPLVAEKNINKANFLVRFADKLIITFM